MSEGEKEKKDKGGNPGGAGKADGGIFKKAIGRVMESAGSQAISDWTRPFIEKIPVGIIRALGRMQIQKILPYFSIAVTSALPKGHVWSDKLGDFLNEFSAELRQRISKVIGGEEEPAAVEGKVKVDKKAAIGAVKTLFKVLFSPELAGDLNVNLATLEKIMSGRSDKEQAVIYDILGSMPERDLAWFFDQFSDASKEGLDLFFKRFLPKEEKKEEKTFKKIVAELRQDIHEFSAGSSDLKELGKDIWTEILGPIWKTVDGWFAEGSIVQERFFNPLHEFATSRHEESRQRRLNQR